MADLMCKYRQNNRFQEISPIKVRHRHVHKIIALKDKARDHSRTTNKLISY